MWNMLLPMLLTAGGTFLGMSGNDKAAAGIDKAVAGVQATDNSIANTAGQIAAAGGTGPGAAYLRNLVADPNTLNPAQKAQLADLRVSTNNQLHGSDFAGSGRTAAAVFKKTEDDFVNDALASNAHRADSAANTLSSNSNAATGQEFNALQAGANAGLTGAENDANLSIANSKLMGSALGDIGSIISKGNKLASLS